MTRPTRALRGQPSMPRRGRSGSARLVSRLLTHRITTLFLWAYSSSSVSSADLARAPQRPERSCCMVAAGEPSRSLPLRPAGDPSQQWAEARSGDARWLSLRGRGTRRRAARAPLGKSREGRTPRTAAVRRCEDRAPKCGRCGELRRRWPVQRRTDWPKSCEMAPMITWRSWPGCSVSVKRRSATGSSRIGSIAARSTG